MSDQLLPPLDKISSTIESSKDQTALTPRERNEALQHELQQLEQINSTIDGVLGSFHKASSDLDKVLHATESTDKLLDIWIRILSQTSYTTKLLSDKNWKGTTRHEEEYANKKRKFDELNQRFQAEKQRKEQEREQQLNRKLEQQRRIKEREESLKRRVYGTSGSIRRSTRGSSTSAARRGTTSATRGSRGANGRTPARR
ncbi:DASH complex subunit [Wickerhamomyces ciferrii]|uniref:DASH complex subunit DUO1 n=1 Tax=Wickerhamomyces ciferrii (strain ATCC 14091 / BCRC 22168 / CBS 111 / JCM 3599 / NBRC 0793 / NRRL Y-1031 F-60-10) TaxID=1206466 RepID=K0KYC8_WICCF|nr:DASH complex subunit [Wickerhamomyces ciferrii]CCH47087.1 DASH complex subunit [Wickerhamomyces ciferrii]